MKSFNQEYFAKHYRSAEDKNSSFASRRLIIFRLALSVAFIFSRTYNLSSLPLFSDEAFAILEAGRLTQSGKLLAMFERNTQPVFIWTTAFFQSLPFPLLISGRLVSIICGWFTALMLAKLSMKYVAKDSWWMAFILTAILPFTLFYDRTVLFESMTLALICLSIFIPIPAVSLAILTKQTGWLALPLVIGLRRKNKKQVFLIILSTLAITYVVWWLAIGKINIFSSAIFRQQQHLALWVNLKNNLLRTRIWLNIYLTRPIILLTFLGFILEIAEAKRFKKITPLTILGLWLGFIVGSEVLIARVFYPRYLYPIIIPLALLAAKGWRGVFLTINRINFGRMINWGLKLSISLLILTPAMSLDWKIITIPDKAEIAYEDHFQFFEDWTSGVGAREINQKIKSIAAKNKIPISVYLENDNSYMVSLIDDKNLAEVNVATADWLIDPLTVIPPEILNEKAETLFIRNLNPDIPADWRLEELLSVNKTPVRKVTLYRIIKQ